MRQVVRGVLKNNSGKILLVKHVMAENWTLPGGHMEQGENIYETLHREILEEFNLKIEITGYKDGITIANIIELPKPISIYKINYTSKKYGKVEKLEYIFNAKVKSGDIKIQEEEIADYKWFTKDEILKLDNTFEQIKIFIKNN